MDMGDNHYLLAIYIKLYLSTLKVPVYIQYDYHVAAAFGCVIFVPIRSAYSKWLGGALAGTNV